MSGSSNDAFRWICPKCATINAIDDAVCCIPSCQEPRPIPTVNRVMKLRTDEPSGSILAEVIRHGNAAVDLASERLDRINELEARLNTPEVNDFLKGVRIEAAHQRERWGAPHDREKSAEHWYWLMGYLGGKALFSAITGDLPKAKHHCISSAAALYHWHTAISQDTTGSGRGRDIDLQACDCAPTPPRNDSGT